MIYPGDCLSILPTLEAESIQCCVTSPPYDDLRAYNPLPWGDFRRVARELYRVLCPGGVLCWNVGDSVVGGSETLTSAKQAIFFHECCGFRVHDTMIYEKTNFGQPERVRYHQVFEYVFILSKGAPRCFNPIKDKRNICVGTGTVGRNTMRESDGSMGTRKRNIISEYGMRGNVWRGLTAGRENMGNGVIHPAMMPTWLARDLVFSWSNPGDTVLDPFCGSGTTGMVAYQLGREFVGIELNPEYCEMAEARIAPAKAQGLLTETI